MHVYPHEHSGFTTTRGTYNVGLKWPATEPRKGGDMASMLRNAFIAVFFFMAAISANAAPLLPSKALFFDGIDDWIEVPDGPGSALDITGSVTLEAWVRFQNYPNCCWNTVAAKTFSHPTENTSYGLSFSNHSGSPVNNVLVGMLGYETEGLVYTDATPVRDNAWHHLATVLDSAAGMASLYVDGVLKATAAQTSPLHVTDFSFYIGNAPGFDRRTFEGYIDEVRLWSEARTAEQIATSMNVELTGSESSLAGYWNFNEDGGTLALDNTGHGNHGLFIGAPTRVLDGPLLIPVSEPTSASLLAGAYMVALIRRGRREAVRPKTSIRGRV